MSPWCGCHRYCSYFYVRHRHRHRRRFWSSPFGYLSLGLGLSRTRTIRHAFFSDTERHVVHWPGTIADTVISRTHRRDRQHLANQARPNSALPLALRALRGHMHLEPLKGRAAVRP